MSFITDTLASARPQRIREVELPARVQYYPSPADWRDEVLYFLLPDRFSDGREATRELYDRTNPGKYRLNGFRWDTWRQSGGDRFQGGTIQGITSKLDYIKNLGATTIWVGPVFKQRVHVDSYHGYAIQDFLEVDKRFGTRQDLVDLIAAAHEKNLRVILDVILNHTGHNWNYQNNLEGPRYLNWPNYYPFGNWIDAGGNQLQGNMQDNDGVWPVELQAQGAYTRAGMGSLSDDDVDNPEAESKRTDFPGFFRDINFDGNNTIDDLARCYKYWIALTDCDGFRVDTLKHIAEESASIFCNTIKEFAANIGKKNFFIVGEVAGPDSNADRYLDVIGLNMNATLDIGNIRPTLRAVAKGILQPDAYFTFLKKWIPELGSHRNSAPRHVTILDDHDHVFGQKTRFSTDAPVTHQVIVGVAIQLFSLGIPCTYYGTEQAFAGPEKQERDQWLPDFYLSTTDRYLRETMFGADHPRQSGLPGVDGNADASLPGFGAFGSVGAHFFDQNFEVYRRIAALTQIRAQFPVLRYGRLYQREIANFGAPFALPQAGELIAWSRLLDEEECICIVNGNATAPRGGDVIVDAALNSRTGAFFEVVTNTAELIAGSNYQGPHPRGERLPVQFIDGAACISIRNLAPAEVIVLNNRP
jgi:glycosidase